MKTTVIIVAGGSGTRMGSGTPKQFLKLAGKPVIVRSFEIFRRTLPDSDICIALPEEYHETWEQMAAEYGLGNGYMLCKGGDTRFMTVKNSIDSVDPCDIVLIHDAVRPLVTANVILDVVDGASRSGACVPAVVPVDSFRALDAAGGSLPVDRSGLRAVQTPQGFRYDLLKEAYGQPYDEKFTDDATVAQSAGHRITFCDGARFNMKITYPEDIAVAEFLYNLFILPDQNR